MGRSLIGNENLQTIYQWKTLGEENALEQSFPNLVYCASLALRKKKIG
jgi:hypothetical protein